MGNNIVRNEMYKIPEHILKSLEMYWDINFPKSYRDFLLKYNGGEAEKREFKFKEGEHGSDIRSFLGIYPDKHNNLLSYLKSYRGRIPENFFPIGYDSCGNLILISVKNKDRGKIYFWDHEMEADEGETPDYSNLTLIADSFDEFIEGLHSEDEISDDI